MKPRAQLLVIALLITSPVHAQSGPVQRCSPHFTSSTPCSVDTFAGLVCNMASYDANNFRPSAGNAAKYQSPRCDTSKVVGLQPLKDAYALAPDSVKAALCQLKHIFVTTKTTSSSTIEPLGIWESSDRGDGAVYVTLPDTLIAATASLAQEENGLLGRLLLTTPGGAYPPAGRPLPAFQDSVPASTGKAAGILAVLAHELGHVVLSDTNADGTGGDGHAHPRPCPPPRPPKNCFESAILGAPRQNRGWSKATFHGKMRRWTEFGMNGNVYQDPARDYRNVAADMGLPVPNFPPRNPSDTAASTDIHAIYSGSFASLVAAVSPEEDLVETYKYSVLAAAANNGLSLRITFPAASGFPGYPTINVLDDIVRKPSTELTAKIQCINSLTAVPY